MVNSRILSSTFRFSPARAGPLEALLARPLLRQSPLLQSARLQRRKLCSTSPSNAAKRPASRDWQATLLRRFRNIRKSSDKHSPSPAQGQGSAKSQSLSERFKDLSRRYGRAAIWVYLGLSALDFPFCFLAVRLVGPERIGEWEDAAIDGFWNLVGVVAPSMRPREGNADDGADVMEAAESVSPTTHKHQESSLATQALLAYGVHKSLIFFRVPLTAAVTPKVVKVLRARGWNIGKPAKPAVGGPKAASKSS